MDSIHAPKSINDREIFFITVYCTIFCKKKVNKYNNNKKEAGRRQGGQSEFGFDFGFNLAEPGRRHHHREEDTLALLRITMESVRRLLPMENETGR